MHLKGIHFRSALSNARPHMPAILRQLAGGRLHPELVVTDVLPFDSAAEALPAAGFKPVFVREPAGPARTP
jgi:alcohol dehydrogenase